MVALIPARAGSKRVPGKNTKLLGGQPLIAYTIRAAQESGVFSDVIVTTEDADIRELAYTYGAHGMFRPVHTAADDAADILWVRDFLMRAPTRFEAFAILRPTSPFRTADTIRRAFAQFTLPDQTADSIRAVQPCREHPGKMWALNFGVLTPLLNYTRSDDVPWHSCPTQTLPTFYVQNSSLEMAWTANVEVHGTIHGRKVAPFFTEGDEGFAIDYPEDWERAEAIMRRGPGGPAHASGAAAGSSGAPSPP